METIGSLDEQKRRKIVIDFIISNQGCIQEDVVRGVEENIGRKKVLKIVRDVTNEHIITIERAKPNSRDIKLFINTDNPLITIPKKLDEFEKIFFPFLENLVNVNRKTIVVLSSEISTRFDQHKENLRKTGNESLTSDYYIDADIHTTLEELSIHLSPFVKAIEIFNELSRAYTISSIVHWPQKIKDRESLNKLLFIVFTKLADLQIKIRDKVSPLFSIFFESANIGTETVGRSSIDLEEIVEYYSYFGLEKEIEPILSHIRKISGILLASDQNPFNKWGIISPVEVSIEIVREFFDPRSYYRDQTKKE